MSKIIDHTILAKTRAEEHDADVWGRFFIPPYFQQLNLRSATRSTYIIGKRGCGKTMLLKYMDYHTAFSRKRLKIPDDEISHVGIYWRVDTQFSNSLKSRGLTEDQWISIFDSYFALVTSIEILRATKLIADSTFARFSKDDYSSLKISCASDFHPDFPTSPIELEFFLEASRRRFTTWISNISSLEQPLLPPGRDFVSAIIQDLRATPGLEEIAFYVYVDEVENLVSYQRRVLNNYLKHSQRPLIVSFTSKELSPENRTTGLETVNATHDFRLISLDDLQDSPQREVFFAEVFLANLELAEKNSDAEFLPSVLEPDNLKIRQTQDYRDRTLNVIRTLFPSRTAKELAADALNHDRINKILWERVELALTRRRFSRSLAFEYAKFTDVPEALVVLPALLNRSSLNPESILKQLRLYSDDSSGSFQSTWIHNNLIGALLELYRPYQPVCPIYSGFDTFCTMSGNNLRHFLILTYKALEVAELMEEDSQIFSIDIQARAAYEAAQKLIEEIKTFGEYGERLRMFVLRLGGVFRSLQAQPAMSEPEQNQFTINSGDRALNDIEMKFISEAKKYAILVEKLETKTKNKVGSDIVDYQLNPIYSPYFQISYRKKRKIEISVDQFQVLALGTEDAYQDLSNKLVRGNGKQNELGSTQMGLWQ
ncbi:MAG TPA: hypothetical protein VE092_01315 [Herbaspirillum sp.]|uniref:ORC-CDC6 family AAA ATPase n=1 Tax=Herbaspirillum sp. TaxID=1890675 RepID=UPI002D5B84F4|nr:hypothetical protein [Herbaspirillum sp.]HZG18625.1 hypothetical protein [Herbaspirillum sp.]